MSRVEMVQRILVGLAIVLLVCALKNYLILLISDSPWCLYVCPSFFEWSAVEEAPPGLRQWFLAQQWLLSGSQDLTNRWFSDPWGLISVVLVAPLVEETLYRGPMYLTRKHSGRPLWWSSGVLLVGVFALSHGRSGLALLPLIALGLCGLWLVAATRRLWPAVALHVLYNFFMNSMTLYQSLWSGE